MITMLAQSPNEATPPTTVLDAVTGVFSRADTLAHPLPLLTHLQTLSVVWAMIFFVAGVLCLVNGYRFYRTATVALALVIGIATGYTLGMQIRAPYIVAGSLGVLAAVVCFPLMKYAIAVLGGLSGAWVGANIWTAAVHVINRGDAEAAQLAAANHWIGALIGLIVFGMLAFIMFKLSIVLFTSVSGSTIAVLGVLALLLQFKPWQEQIRSGLSAHAIVIPMLVFIPALIGLVLQEAAPESPAAKDT